MLRKQLKAEVKKIQKLPGIIIVTLLCFLFFVMLYYQKAINIHSGFFTPDLLTIEYMSSFNLLLLSLVGFVPISIVGAYIGGIDYVFNTNVYTIGTNGRLKSTIVKMITLFIIILTFICFTVILGVVESIMLNRIKLQNVDWNLLIKQVFSCYIILSLSGLLGFFGATITKRVYGGIMIGTVFPIIFGQMVRYTPFLHPLTIESYTSSIVYHSFHNLSNDPQIQIQIVHPLTYETSLFIIFALIILFCFITTIMVTRRNFNA